MCAHYESPHDKALLKKHFGIDPPSELAKRDVWPGYMSTFICRHPHADVGDDAVPSREALLGSFGLIPHWSKDNKIARHTYNARSELHEAGVFAVHRAPVSPGGKMETWYRSRL